MTNPRYDGFPLLRLLELHVISEVDKLSQEQEASLQRMTPKLNDLYGIQGSWKQVLEGVMQMPPGSRDKIMAAWDAYSEHCRTTRETPDPQHFAERFVDVSLGHAPSNSPGQR
jgi:hypothetical protein